MNVLMQGGRSMFTRAAMGSIAQVRICLSAVCMQHPHADIARSAVCPSSNCHPLRAVIKGNRREMGVEELVCLGGFRNVRSDFDWAGCKLELDETQFEWGTVYEIEVESVRARPKCACGSRCLSSGMLGRTVDECSCGSVW